MDLGLKLTIVLIGHVAADFYLQTNAIAREKRNSHRLLAVHCILYGACLTLFSAFLFSIDVFLIAGFIFFITHALFDYAKVGLQARGIATNFKLFAIDQICHVAVCFGVALAFEGHPTIELFATMQTVIGYEACIQMLAVVLSLLVAWRPASIFVQQLLASIRGADDDREIASEDDAGSEEQRAGRWIGVLERTIVVVLTFFGQFGAIAFVLTAKSIARFNKLSEDKDFAECYLVGTLASSAIAILVTLLFQSVVTWQLP